MEGTHPAITEAGRINPRFVRNASGLEIAVPGVIGVKRTNPETMGTVPKLRASRERLRKE